MTEENFILVELRDGKIERVIRSYLSARRANEDLELLSESKPDATYRVDAVAFVDS